MWVRLKKWVYLNLCQFYIINWENGDIYIYIYIYIRCILVYVPYFRTNPHNYTFTPTVGKIPRSF